MNQNRSVVGALLIIGTLLILSGLGEQPPRKLQLVIGIGLILAALVQAIRRRKPE
jgi:hypothetical protein